MPIDIPFVSFAQQTSEVREELLKAVDKVLASGQFILGPEVAAFEEEFARYCGSKFAVGVSNGTSALYLAVRALGIGTGDEVITVSNSFIATASAIVLAGAKPVLIDIAPDLNLDVSKLEGAITSRTKAIMPVHLTGRVANMPEIMRIAKKRGIPVIEDAAQAVGATLGGKKAGSFGEIGCFSLHPLKNLRAFGDGGIVTTDDPKLCELLRKLRNIGQKTRYEVEYWSFNCRLDEMQAAMLRINLKHLDRWTEERRKMAFRYNEILRPYAVVPDEKAGEFHAYQTYMVRVKRRDALQKFLLDRGIDTKVHYPVPIHRQEVAGDLRHFDAVLPETNRAATEIMSLPLWSGLGEANQRRIAALFKEFYES